MRCSREGTGLSRKETAHHADDAPLVQAFALGSCDSGQREAKFTSGGGQPSEEAKVSAAFKAKIGTEDGNAGLESHRRTTYVVHREAPPLSKQDVDMIGRVPKHKRITGQPSSSEELNRHNPIPELELTLKSSNDEETEEMDGMHMLNHLKVSAFSRYNSNKKFRTIFPSTAGDPKQMEGVAQRPPCLRGFTSNREIKHKDFAAQSVHSESSSLIPQVGLFPIPGVIFDGGGMGYAPMFQPVYNPKMVPKASSPKSAFQREESPFLTSPSLHSNMGTHSSTRGCSGLDEATKPSSIQASRAAREVKVMHSVDPGGCSSTPCNNDYTTPSMMATSAMEESVRDDDGSHTFDLDKFRSRMGHHQSAEREAALVKFRLKRKGRCFEKKVTNQSRKRLAEQRPKVKGQFFHQAPSDPVIAGVDKP